MTTNYRDDLRLTTLLELCRRLRVESTDAEQLLWRLIRNRQVASAKFRRQHQFGEYILDFYCRERNLVIEIDGSQHTEKEVASKDAMRSQYLGSRGIRVLRFNNLQVLKETEGVLESIWLELTRTNSGQATKTPSP